MTIQYWEDEARHTYPIALDGHKLWYASVKGSDVAFSGSSVPEAVGKLVMFLSCASGPHSKPVMITAPIDPR